MQNEIDENTPYKRIKILDLPYDTTRAHLEELSSKYGRVSNVEIDRSERNRIVGFVTYTSSHDAAFAVYRLEDFIYRGIRIRVYPAHITQEEIERKKKEKLERQRTRMEGEDARKKSITIKNVKKKKRITILSRPS